MAGDRVTVTSTLSAAHASNTTVRLVRFSGVPWTTAITAAQGCLFVPPSSSSRCLLCCPALARTAPATTEAEPTGVAHWEGFFSSLQTAPTKIVRASKSHFNLPAIRGARNYPGTCSHSIRVIALHQARSHSTCRRFATVSSNKASLNLLFAEEVCVPHRPRMLQQNALAVLHAKQRRLAL